MSAGAGEHTPEPWVAKGSFYPHGVAGDVFAKDAHDVRDCTPICRVVAPVSKRKYEATGQPIDALQATYRRKEQAPVIEANAARIVACVNACAGIPTDQLSTLMGEVRGVLAQYRDDLRRPPAADSTERRLAAVTALIAKLPMHP